MNPAEPLTDEQFRNALDRVARTEDGRTLYLFLQRRLMGVCSSLEDGALRDDQGERSFAAKLIGLMAKGIAESGGRTTSDNGSSTGSGDQPIVFAVPQPRSVARRGGNRRVTADTVIPGWNDTADQS